MKATANILTTALALVSVIDGASAQEAPDSAAADSIYQVEEIRVNVARLTSAGGASAVAVSLDSVRAGPAPTLSEVLRRLPLIQIRANSRGEAQPRLRGIGSRRVAVLIDDIPLTLGWDDRTDLSIIPLSAAREITMTRGLSSVLDGPNAVGGVVRVEMAEGETPIDPAPFYFAGSVDELGSGQGALGLATVLRGDSGDLLLRAGGGYRNRSAFPRPAGVPPAVPGASDDRLNSDFAQANGYFVGGYRAHGGTWLSLTSFAFGSDKGVPPELNVADPRLWRYPNASRWVTAISAGSGWRRTPLGEGDVEVSLGIDFGETDIDSYATLAYDSIVERELGEDRTLSARLMGDHTLGSGIVSGAFTLAETRHEETLLPDDERATYRQVLWSVGLELDQPFGSLGRGRSRGAFTLGLSLDHASTPETGGREPRDPITDWGARVGGSLAVGRGATLLTAGLSRRVRFPALRELYSGALGRFVVNPGLNPEKLLVLEGGATGRASRFEYQAIGFYQRMTDGIVRVGLGNGQFQRQNRDRLTAIGAELVATYSPGRGVVLGGDLTLQETRQEDPAAPETQLEPEYSPWIAGSLQLAGPIVLGIRGSARVRHQGRQFCVNPDTGADDELRAQTWANLELARAFNLRNSGAGRTLELAVALDNFTDASAFDQCGLPQAGRLLRVGVSIF